MQIDSLHPIHLQQLGEREEEQRERHRHQVERRGPLQCPLQQASQAKPFVEAPIDQAHDEP